MAVAARILTIVGTSNSEITPPENSARVMIPIDFWASLEPWENAIVAAVTICIFLKRWFSLDGLEFSNTLNKSVMMM